MSDNLVHELRGVGPDDSVDCDMCQGTFESEVMNPVSGDWWLCSDCLRKYMLPGSDEVVDQ